VEIAEEQEARLDWGISLRVLGEIYMKQGEFDKAREILQEAFTMLEDLGSDYEAGKTTLVLCQLALDSGTGFDRKQLEQAYMTFEDLGAKAEIEQAKTLLK
jgi:tetratricopeptide (TPR) repeat protein